MFGLSIRKTLAQAIANACQNNRNVYKEAIKRNLSMLTDDSDEEQNELARVSREEYLTKVFDDVVKAFNVSSPNIEQRVRLAIMNPEICGVPDRDIDNGVMAGTVYAICYWAIKNKTAKSGDCIALNHYQNDIMNEVLQELNTELQK